LKKRIFILALFLAFCSFPGFSFSIVSLAQGNFKQLDLPLIDGITYFQRTIGTFYRIALVLANLLGVVCILWNVFRLWIGTQEVRKACVDIITKFLIFIFLMNSYPLIVNGVIDTSINIGMHAGSGYQKVNAAFYALREDCEAKIKASQETLYKILAEAQSGTAVDSEVLKVISQMTYIEEKDVVSFLKDKGVDVYTEDDFAKLGNNSWWNKIFLTGEQSNVMHRTQEFIKSVNADALDAMYENKDLQQAIITMKAMQEVMVKQEVDGITENGESKISRYLYNPFMTDKEGKQTNMLSPGAMIKTAVLISDILSRQGSIEFSSEKNGFIEKKLDETFQKIISLILVVLMTFGLILASVFCVIQYVMCIFEYFIVTSVGVLFIPFALWDGTKSFAAKLITLFTSFFIKIMVMILCLFWVYSAFIYMGVSILSSNEPISFLSFSYFMFTCLLGWVVTQNGPQIAVTILNGSPQLSMGEFLHAAGTAAAGAVMAKRAAGTAGAALSGGAKAVQAGVRGGQTIDAAFKGSTAAVKTAQDASGETLTKGQQFRVGMGALGSIIGNGVKNTAARLLTGQEKKEGGISVGGGYSVDNQAKDGSRAHRDSENASKAMGNRYGEQWAEKNAPKVPEEPTGIEGQTRE
jgi:type IV secretion system protein TrbL